MCCAAVRLPSLSSAVLVLYYSVFMGGSFGFRVLLREGLEGGNSVYCPFAVLIHVEFR